MRQQKLRANGIGAPLVIGRMQVASRALDIPGICVGGSHSGVAIDGAIRSGACDAVSAARAFIADPYLYRNLTGSPALDRPECGSCKGCIARFGGEPVDVTARRFGHERTRFCVAPSRPEARPPMPESSYPAKTTSLVAPLMLREDLARDAASGYWSAPHGEIVKRTLPGIVEYVQHHFSSTDHGFWPATATVGTVIPESWRVDGCPEVRFRSTAAALTTPLHLREVFFDEQNVFGRVLSQPTGPGGGRWWTDGFDDTIGHRVALLLRRRRGVRGRAFRRFVHEQIGPGLLAAGARDLRTYTFLPYSRFMAATPGVAHDNPVDRRYHATVIFGTESRQAVDALLASPQVARLVAEQHTVLTAVHAFGVERSVPVVRMGSASRFAGSREPRLRRHTATLPY